MFRFNIGLQLRQALNLKRVINMPFKMFTNAVEGHVDESIAINSDHIVNVYERVTTVATAEGNKEKKVTILFAGPVGSWEVKEDYLTVVARLNERD
jgi:5-deoxy-D-glucuronate isomerase